MGFREMSAWVMAVLMAALGLFYLANVSSGTQALGEVAPPDIRLISVATVLLVVGAVLAHIVAAAASPEDANAPEDERDKLVVWRAGNVSGWVLGSGVFVGLWHFYFQGNGNIMFHILVMSLIVSQLTASLLEAYYYRRGL